MATLKDLIKTETLKVGSHGAMPSNSSVTINTNKTNINTWEEITTVVAPSDGYLEITANALGNGSVCSIQILASVAHCHEWGGDRRNRVSAPACKGRTISIYGQFAKGITMRFIKSIGGGYKRYLKALSRNCFGGSLWLRLRTTSETLRKPEAGPHSLVGKLLISNISVRRHTRASERTLRPQTDILPFGLMQRPMLLPKPFRAMPASSCQRMLKRSGLGALSLAGRGKSVNTPFSVLSSFKERRCSFIQRVACNNARMEVAA